MDSSGYHRITRIRFLTASTFVLTFERRNLEFRAGQRIIAGTGTDIDQREYSIYSGENDDFLEILVKKIDEGSVSVKLSQCKPGDLLQVNGPFGVFGIDAGERLTGKHVFIATGTGISPFHGIVRSYPGIDYLIIHGVSYASEAYERSAYEAARYILCTSKEISDERQGRVTKFLPEYRTPPGASFYLCGNGNMIYEVWHILREKGIPAERIFSEIYF
ncbi:MAG TPA: FAD-binding oxidoreductase [Bacteroidales bacterium]|jgi:ferredoxin--NADP+ reductase/benzoate/toluate 1,2-dioxygenase reductase subunit|nr:FAD-binding oxidoreductase [Bacteroidales bacterium]